MKYLLLFIALLVSAAFVFTARATEPFVFIVPQGGTGSSTLGGILLGNGTGAVQSVVIGSNLTWDGTTLSASGADGGSNWQFSGISAITPTTTVGIIINASSTVTADLHVDGTITQNGVGLVPYTGASASVDIGINSFITTGAVNAASLELGDVAINQNDINSITIAGQSGNAVILETGSLTGDQTFTFPDQSGTIALTSNTLSTSLTKGNFIVGDDAGVAQATSTVFISSTGLVGIGTTTPNALISVHGDSVNAARIRFSNPNQVSSGFQIGASGPGASPNLEFWNFENSFLRFGTNSTERLRILASGNVGIGGTNPQGLLTLFVNSEAGDPELLLNNANTPSASNQILGSIWFGSAEGNGFRATGIRGFSQSDFNASDFHSSLQFYTTPNGSGTPEERVRIDPEGRVGIGLTSFTGQLSASSTSFTTLAITQNGSSAAATFTGGNVGIGTTTPISTFSVVGNTATTSIYFGSASRKTCVTWYSVPSGNPFREYITDAGVKVIEAGQCSGK